jgi:N-methylhydantoinase A
MASELNVQVPGGTLSEANMGAALDAFHEAHDRAYGYSYKGEQLVEIVNIRVSGTGPTDVIEPTEADLVEGDGSSARTGERAVYFGPDDGSPVCALYDRSKLSAGEKIVGPAIVEQYDSTIVVPPWADAKVDGYRNLVIERR